MGNGIINVYMDKIPKNNKQEAIIRHVGTGKIPKINNCPDPFISYIRVVKIHKIAFS